MIGPSGRALEADKGKLSRHLRAHMARQLAFAKPNMPLKARLGRPGYAVLIDTPRSSVPLVFLSAVSTDGRALNIEGDHIRRTHPDAIVYSHSFYVREANGEPLKRVVRDQSGQVLGRESLRYRIRVAGVAYGIEYI